MGTSIEEPGLATATVLFTDLVGSTGLRSQLGEEAAEELRRRHDLLLASAVETHHGQVVKGLGDGVMATFAGASDGVAAAVAIQQAIDRHNRSATRAVPLSVRIGLSAGDVSFEEGDCFGTPVIEAARLCAAASGGQILAAEMVRWLVRGGGDRFSSVGTLDLKGLPDPVPACEVAWPPLPGAPVSLPPLLTDVGRIFVGRGEPLHRLEELWKEAVAGERRVALVAGEPGVGKTRLVAELARKAHAVGTVVLAGRCDEDLGVPFQPFVEALRHLVDHVEASELPRRLGRYAGELERLLPGLSECLGDTPAPLRSDPETERYRLFEAVTAWLAASSAHEPVLLILDDLQWAAKPTLLLLRHIVRSPERAGLLIVGTYRDTELQHDHPLVELLADLRRDHGIERLSLSGFDQAAVADFMAQAAGHEMDEDGLVLARTIHAETEGNPFFVREILRHLTETGAVVERDGRWVTNQAVEDLGVPEGVREVVGRRVARLSRDANRVLRVAAVVGTEFELPVVGGAGEIDEDALLSAVEEAMAARLVLEIPGPAGRHRFTHALVRETLYDQLSGNRRVALHRRAAEMIEELHADALDDHLPALAHHWARASAAAAEWALAADYATRAGDRSLAQLANDEAAGYYRQALELREQAGAPPDARLCALMISLGEAQRRAGDAAHRDTLLAAGHLAQQLGAADLLARAALANHRGLFSRAGAVDGERVAALEVAVRAAGRSDSRERAQLLAALASELHFAYDERRVQLAREGLAIARRLGEPSTLAGALVSLWLASWDFTAVGERSILAGELSQIAGQLDDPVLEFHVGMARCLTGSEQGDAATADQGLRTCTRIAEDLGQPVLRWRAAGLRSHRAFMDARWDDVERFAQEALRLGEAAGQPDAASLSDICLLRILQGRPEEAAALIRRLVEQFAGSPVYHAALAWACADAGRGEESRVIVTRLRRPTFEALPRDYLGLVTLVFLSRACARLGETSSAQELYDLLRPHQSAVAIGQSVWLGPVAYDLGLLAATLGRYDEADAHFAEAVEIHDRLGVRGMLAHTCLEWARALLTRRHPGDGERAQDLLTRAEVTAREVALDNIERGAVALRQELP